MKSHAAYCFFPSQLVSFLVVSCCVFSSISIFLLGSILCATTQTITWLIGVGAMSHLVQVILSDISTMSEQGLYMAIAVFAWLLGTNMGIPNGGAIGERTIW